MAARREPLPANCAGRPRAPCRRPRAAKACVQAGRGRRRPRGAGAQPDRRGARGPAAARVSPAEARGSNVVSNLTGGASRAALTSAFVHRRASLTTRSPWWMPLGEVRTPSSQGDKIRSDGTTFEPGGPLARFLPATKASQHGTLRACVLGDLCRSFWHGPSPGRVAGTAVRAQAANCRARKVPVVIVRRS